MSKPFYVPITGEDPIDALRNAALTNKKWDAANQLVKKYGAHEFQQGKFLMTCPKCGKKELHFNLEVFLCMSCNIEGSFEELQQLVSDLPGDPKSHPVSSQ